MTEDSRGKVLRLTALHPPRADSCCRYIIYPSLFMCSCFTHLAGNPGASANKAFTICHRGFIFTVHPPALSCFLISVILAGLCDFQAVLREFFLCLSTQCCSEEGPRVFICEDETAHLALSKFAEQAEGDSPQSAVSFLISVPQRRAEETL